MLNRISEFLKKLGTPANADSDLLDGLLVSNDVSLDLARAILFVDLALIDGNFEAREYEFIMNSLQQDLGISHQDAINLVKTASSQIQYRGSHSFAVELQRRLDVSARQQIMNQVRHLIMVDNQSDGFEKYLEKKFSDLLGV